MPRSSRPMSSIFDLIPTALKTTSAEIVNVSFLFSTLTSTLSPRISDPVTLVEQRIFIPDFFNIFSNSLEISLSSFGAIFFSYSTNVTFVPIEL